MTDTTAPEVTRATFLSMQVCVPAEWSDMQVEEFAESESPAGTEHGWVIRRQGDPALCGDPERQPCDSREGCVHVMLDC